ncbi:unnamed protein product [Bathycoccus prasinos]|jgi:hypothetical protein
MLMKEKKEKKEKKKRKSTQREEEENGDKKKTKTKSATGLESKSTRNLNDIDAEIERVLSRLKNEKESENDSSNSESSSSSSSSSSLGRIAPLPPEAYPEHYGYGSKRGNEFAFKGKREGKALAPRSNVLIPGLAEREKNRPKCELCELSFTSRAQLEEHLQGKGHRKKAAFGGGGGARSHPGQRQQQHIRREVKPPDGPHCKLCKKIFTSLAQKEEHEGGKWHKMRVDGKLAPSNKPYVM